MFGYLIAGSPVALEFSQSSILLRKVRVVYRSGAIEPNLSPLKSTKCAKGMVTERRGLWIKVF